MVILFFERFLCIDDFSDAFNKPGIIHCNGLNIIVSNSNRIAWVIVNILSGCLLKALMIDEVSSEPGISISSKPVGPFP